VDVLAVETTQWMIAMGSLGSALVALALGLGLKDWVVRPQVRLVLRHAGETAAFVRLRLDNRGRSTARNVGVRVLKMYRWDPAAAAWIRTRPELDGRLLQPSNQLTSEPDLVDVFPYTDRIVDLASVELGEVRSDTRPIFVEISRPWPPDEANALEPATWRLELLVCGDNIRPQRSFVTLAYDGSCPDADPSQIWSHFLVDGPFSNEADRGRERRNGT